MNIFYLDPDPVTCAQMLSDRHLPKMILETAQLLCSAHHIAPTTIDRAKLYKPTHVNHPCAIWVRASTSNYMWTYRYFLALCDEFNNWRGKRHATDVQLRNRLQNAPGLREAPLEAPPCVMPAEYIGRDPVTSYRIYYAIGKSHLLAYNRRPAPHWITS